MAELLLGQPIFPGDSGVDQLVEIIKVLGTPTRDQIREMNPNYTEFKFPQIKAHPWQKVVHHLHKYLLTQFNIRDGSSCISSLVICARPVVLVTNEGNSWGGVTLMRINY